MRSSKSRSRSKSNRGNNRTPANNLNRVFDSSGPEGKVRGTPQQIIDKYTQLARDAQLSNDRVAAENFQQHAEHYTRLLAEAQRDADESRARADQQNRDRQQQQPQQQQPEQQQPEQPRPQSEQPRPQSEQPRPQSEQPRQQSEQPRPSQRKPRERKRPELPGDELPSFITAPAGDSTAADVVDVSETGGESGLVETPEGAPKKKPAPRPRKPRAPKPEAQPDPDTGSEAAE